MLIVGNLLVALAKVVNLVLTLFMWLVIARAVLSWVSPDPYNPIVRFIYRATDPVLDRVRRWVPLNMGGIDFSPILVLLAVVFLQEFVGKSLMDIGIMLAR